ncbi:MAG TPA: hypothetical protein VF263_11505 [Longimicrobiaceae bacterium]
MTKKIAQGLWTAGVLAGLASGVLAVASTPATASAQDPQTCYRCECSDLGCVCSLIACPPGDP